MITVEEYLSWMSRYFKTKPQYLRFGQSFWNEFLTLETEKEDRLFYEPDTSKAIDIIRTHYIK